MCKGILVEMIWLGVDQGMDEILSLKITGSEGG